MRKLQLPLPRTLHRDGRSGVNAVQLRCRQQVVSGVSWLQAAGIVGSRDVRHCTEHEVQPDPVTGFETAVHRFWAHARCRHLPFGIVSIGVVDLP